MKEVIIQTSGGQYFSWFNKGNSLNNDTVIVYYHGLEGSSKIVKPLIEKFGDYDLYSIEERGHTKSFQKPSIKISKHLKDINFVVQELRKKYKKIYLLGESMGGVFTSLYGFKNNNINGVFTWSIPFIPKDIMIESARKKNWIKFRTVLTFFTGINYKYTSNIDYPKLTNSSFLLRLHQMNIKTLRQTTEAVATWKGGLKLKRFFYFKKPLSPIFCWYGEHDFMINTKIVKKIQKNKNVFFDVVPQAKHILMFESNASLMYDEILKIIKLNN